jgi:hypothetical protein
MDTAVMVLSILFHAKNNYYLLKKLQKIWWFEIKALYLYQEIKTTTL